jgi:hypothetical protein
VSWDVAGIVLTAGREAAALGIRNVAIAELAITLEHGVGGLGL